MKSRNVARVGSWLAACVVSLTASAAGSANADCGYSVEQLTLELVELELIEGGTEEPSEELALEQERSLISQQATITGDHDNSYGVESIDWRAEGTWVRLEKDTP